MWKMKLNISFLSKSMLIRMQKNAFAESVFGTNSNEIKSECFGPMNHIEWSNESRIEIKIRKLPLEAARQISIPKLEKIESAKIVLCFQVDSLMSSSFEYFRKSNTHVRHACLLLNGSLSVWKYAIVRAHAHRKTWTHTCQKEKKKERKSFCFASI